MAVELGKFLARQLGRLPEGHPDRSLIQGISGVVNAYTEKSITEISPHQSDEDFIINREQFRESTQLSGRARNQAGRLYMGGVIHTPDDLRNIPDEALLKFTSLGRKTLAAIRERYPYSPRQDK